ncbi:VOC family protein [Streptomyces tuirus]|uniref:VOC family protein n=1 Tax=Streptomyces tuirus TaxID=68278 RepID=A0A941J3D2_9ACTN|nr:VOC family protein [Streptomyces tuirus]
MTTSLTSARWTHVALPCADVDRTIDFYTSMTPLTVVDRFRVDDGETVWLANDPRFQTPFVLVFLSFDKDKGREQGLLKPFAHIGIEVPSRADVEAFAERARTAECLHWEPRQMPDPIGYLCALRDPDGNVVEIAYGQRVFDTVSAKWAQS